MLNTGICFLETLIGMGGVGWEIPERINCSLKSSPLLISPICLIESLDLWRAHLLTPNHWLKLREEHESWIRHTCIWILLCPILRVILGHCVVGLLCEIGLMKSLFQSSLGEFEVLLRVSVIVYELIYILLFPYSFEWSTLCCHPHCFIPCWVYLLWELGREWM